MADTKLSAKEKNHGRWKKTLDKIRGIPLSDKIDIIMALLTLISVVLVGKTLTEMQIARDAAYHPCIVMNPIKEKAEWDKEGDLLWLKDKTRSIESTYEEEGEDGEIYGTMKLPLFIFNPSSLIKYSAVNIGVGAATEIQFVWHDENSQTLYKYLCSQDEKNKEFFVDGEKSDLFQCQETQFVLDKAKTYSLMFMEQEARDTYDLYFPVQYSILSGMIMKNYASGTEPLPIMLLTIQFKDIQNKTFQETIAITLTMVERNDNTDGSGNVTYQYNPQLLEIREIKTK